MSSRNKSHHRFWRVFWLVVEPIPKWGDMVQRIATIFVFLSPTIAAFVAKYFGSSQHWTVTNGLLVSAGLFIVITFWAAYRIQQELDDVRDGTPNLVYRCSRHEDATIYDALGHQFGRPTFYNVWFANEPRGQSDRKVAESWRGQSRFLIVTESLLRRVGFTAGETPPAHYKLESKQTVTCR